MKLVLIAAASIALWLLGKSATRHGYETASYEVLHQDGDFEVRRYAAHTLVETPVRADEDDRGGFRRLFGYITGDNARSEKISMTTPVFMAEPAEARSGVMAFVIPDSVADADLPGPRSNQVALRRVEPCRVASLRFYGYRDAARIGDAEARLRARMHQQAMTPAGQPRLAFYDPPWTPGFLRRNEIQFPLVD